MDRLLPLLYLMLPVYAANMAPPFVRFWPAPARPISERWLGSHKTWLGVAFALAAATAVAALQAAWAWPGSLLRPGVPWWWQGLLCGAAAMAGDCFKSFVKRRLGKPPGTRWVPADQLDFAAGGLLALALTGWVTLRWSDVGLVLGFTLLAALAVNRVAFALRLKDTPW
jgi:CDP-2,3-bis-(O-geranylgeranyl)-sn-glycerol synthase